MKQKSQLCEGAEQQSYYDYISGESDLPGLRWPHQIMLPGDVLHGSSLIADWLKEHVEPYTWRWGFQVRGDQVSVDMCVVSFKHQGDMVRFALTFT